MEKTESKRKGVLCLNVMKTFDGEVCAAIKKGYLDQYGRWEEKSDIKVEESDIFNLMECLNDMRL